MQHKDNNVHGPGSKNEGIYSRYSFVQTVFFFKWAGMEWQYTP